MIGILLISHGKMAEGMKDALTMFFGDDIPQLETMSLRLDSSADEFGTELRQKIADVNTGDGVVVFVDLFGGTPCNQALQNVSNSVHLIAGMNLTMVMELLGMRYGNLDVSSLVKTGRDGVVDVGAMFFAESDDAVDDD